MHSSIRRFADAEPARRPFDVQQPQFRHGVGILDDHDRTDAGSVAFGDPAPFTGGIEVLEDLRHDFGRERFVFGRPAVFLGVERALPRNDPAHVAHHKNGTESCTSGVLARGEGR